MNQDRENTGNIYFVLPAYNEERSLPNLFKRISTLYDSLSEPLTVFVVDDGSTDRTTSIVKQGIQNVDVRLIRHEKNMGLGQAIQTGIKEALDNADDTDIIIIMDADDTHDTALVNPMITDIKDGSDIVIASRFVYGGNDSSAPLFRRFLSRGAAFLFSTVLPLGGIHDFTSGYRAYKVSLLKRASKHWGDRLIEEDGFACMVELLLKLRHWSPVITEVPMHLHYDRKLSTSKIKIFKTVLQYIKLGLRDLLSPPPRAL